MALPYAVVLFIEEDNAPGVVASHWLSADENQTCYPKVSSNLARDKLLKRMASPDGQWSAFQVKVLKKYKTLLDAQNALAKAEETSNLSSEDEEEAKKNRALRKRRLHFEDEEESSYSEAKQMKSNLMEKSAVPPLPSPSSINDFNPLNDLNTQVLPHCSSEPNQFYPPYIPNQTTSNKKNPVPPKYSPTPLFLNNTDLVSPTFSRKNSLPTTPSQCSPNPLLHHHTQTYTAFDRQQNTDHSIESSNRTILHQMQMQLADLFERQGRIESKIDVILKNLSKKHNDGEIENTKPGTFGDLPIAEMNKFEELENALKDEQFMKHLTRLLASLGGKDLKSSVNNIMRRIMSDKLAMKFSYSGKSTTEVQKVAFSKFAVCKCLQMAVRRTYSDATELTIKGLISVWLQQAKSRTSRRKKDEQLVVGADNAPVE